MATAREVISWLALRGVTLQLVGTDGLKVIGLSNLTEREKTTLKAHKPALLQALRQPAEAANDRQSETVSRAPRVKEDPLAMATGVKNGWSAPNCNRCRWYRWRSEICQRQGRVEFANTPACGGNDYQPFAPMLAEREAVADIAREEAS